MSSENIFSSSSGDLNLGIDNSQVNKKRRLFKFPLADWVHKNDIKIVVFDKDGTLIEFQNYWCKWSKSVVGSLVSLYNSLPSENKRPILRSRPNIEDELYKFLGCDQSTGKVNNQQGALCLGDMVLIKNALCDFFKTYVNLSEHDLDSYFNDSFKIAIDDIEKDIKPLGDVKALFSELKDIGCEVAIFTSDVEYASEKAINILNLNEFFENKSNLFLCSDSPSQRRFEKPSGDALRYLADQVGLIPEASSGSDNSWKSKVLMVGDSKTDILSAKKAGVKSLFVESGLYDSKVLRSQNIYPDITAKNVVDDINVFMQSPTNRAATSLLFLRNLNNNNNNNNKNRRVSFNL